MEIDLRPYKNRFAELEQDTSTWLPHWEDIQTYLCPRKGRYLSGDSISEDNSGDIINNSIINGTPTRAVQVLADGIQGGMTSPSRKWFELTLTEPDLAEQEDVKRWLSVVASRMRRVFAQSNFYSQAHTIYHELGLFGTGVMFIEPDEQNVIRCRTLTAGEYYLANSADFVPDSLYRRFALTTKQIVDAFGEDNASDLVQSDYRNNVWDTRHRIVHLIQPRSDWSPDSLLPQGMQYESIYYEDSGRDDKALSVSGFPEKPFATARWYRDGSDTYGRSPAMDALGDAKMLQSLEEKKLKALDKLVDPPMNAPSKLKHATLVAGGVNFIDINQGQQGFVPAYQIRPQTGEVALEIANVERRIQTFFFNDLFISMLHTDKNMTATEASIRNSEKMLLLGPVIEGLQSELYDPIFARVYAIMASRDLIPEPPPSILEQEWEVRYIGLLAQAQRAVESTVIEQATGFVATLAAVQPDVLDKVDFDEAVDQHASLLGVPPAILRSQNDVDEIRQLRADQVRQAQQQQQAAQLVESGKTLSDTTLGADSMLDRMLQVTQ